MFLFQVKAKNHKFDVFGVHVEPQGQRAKVKKSKFKNSIQSLLAVQKYFKIRRVEVFLLKITLKQTA